MHVFFSNHLAVATNWCVVPWKGPPLLPPVSLVAYSSLYKSTPGLFSVGFDRLIGVIFVERLGNLVGENS